MPFGHWETEHTCYRSTRSIDGLKLVPQKSPVSPCQKVQDPFVSFPSSDSCLTNVCLSKGPANTRLWKKHVPSWWQFSRRPSGLGHLWQTCHSEGYLLLQGSFWRLLQQIYRGSCMGTSKNQIRFFVVILDLEYVPKTFIPAKWKLHSAHIFRTNLC